MNKPITAWLVSLLVANSGGVPSPDALSISSALDHIRYSDFRRAHAVFEALAQR